MNPLRGYQKTGAGNAAGVSPSCLCFFGETGADAAAGPSSRFPFRNHRADFSQGSFVREGLRPYAASTKARRSVNALWSADECLMKMDGRCGIRWWRFGKPMRRAAICTNGISMTPRSTRTSREWGRRSRMNEGHYRFVTIRPGAYPWRNHPNAWRPQHIHFSLFGPAFATRLVTQMYFPGDPLLEFDPIFHSVADEAARNLLISRFDWATTTPEIALGFRFDIILRGRNATPMENR